MGNFFGRVVIVGSLVSGLWLPAAVGAGTWQIDPNHSSAQFAVRQGSVAAKVYDSLRRRCGPVVDSLDQVH